ncbi:dolichyl-diphosphooligosaccharide--protein glycosyltransferase subunit 1, partial [Massospora cicadina]
HFGEFLNVNVVRTINLLELQKIRETIGVVVQNTGNGTLEKYYFALSEQKNASLASLAAQIKTEKQALSVTCEHFDAEEKRQYYSVKIPSLQADGKIVLNFKLIHLRGFEPYPASIIQMQMPGFLFSDNVYFLSPYPTATAKTNIKFEGAFSRQIHFALERYGSGSFVKSFQFDLPPGATDAYFRDEIGNVSTSNFRSGKTQSHLQIEPRFPIYGGWHYNWNHGYNLPLSSFLRIKASEPSRFILKVPLLSSLPSVPILNFTFKAVLPDGAKDVKVTSLPIDGFTQQEGIIFTYLDVVGRPVVLIRKEKVIKQHWVDIE